MAIKVLSARGSTQSEIARLLGVTEGAVRYHARRMIAPPPLGRMGARIQDLAAMPVARRSIELYAALAEVAR